MRYGLTFLGLLALVLLEQGWLHWRHRRPIDWLNLSANLNSGHLIMWLLRGVEVAAYASVLAHASTGWVRTWPDAVQWVFGYVAWDLSFFAMHLAHHKVHWLWKHVHSVHHQGDEFSLSLAIRNGWLSSLTDFPFMLPLAVLGVPLEIFIAVSSVHYFLQFFNHIDSRIVDRLGVLDKILVTPSNHRAHHGLQPIYHDRNFGSSLLVWDRLFGTYQPEDPSLDRLYGLSGTKPTNNPLTMNLVAWRSKFDRWRRTEVRTTYIGAGSIVLFCWVAFAVERGSGSGQSLLYGIIAAASIALGMAADGLVAGVSAWLALAIFLAIWVPLFEPFPLPAAMAVVAIAHATCTAVTSRSPHRSPGGPG